MFGAEGLRIAGSAFWFFRHVFIVVHGFKHIGLSGQASSAFEAMVWVEGICFALSELTYPLGQGREQGRAHDCFAARERERPGGGIWFCRFWKEERLLEPALARIERGGGWSVLACDGDQLCVAFVDGSTLSLYSQCDRSLFPVVLFPQYCISRRWVRACWPLATLQIEYGS